MDQNNRLSEAEIRKCLKTDQIGRQMELHASLDSTSNRAKEAAENGAPHGFLVAADFQTAGRGRQGRSFYSPAGSGIYISYVLRLPLPLSRIMLVTPLAAVAAARAIDRVSGVDHDTVDQKYAQDNRIRIKWVNDLILRGKKTGGILCETSSAFTEGRPDYLILGIGINVAPISFPEELRGIATSLGNEGRRSISRSRLIAELSNQLELLLSCPEPSVFMKEYRDRSCVIGRQVTVLSGRETFEAFVRDIDGEGRLLLSQDGKNLTLNSGEIRIINF